MRSHRSKKGAVLIVSLWILAILSMFAIGIGNKLSLEIRSLGNYSDSVQAFYIARAGIERALAERIKLLQEGKKIYADSFNDPWLNSEELFKGKEFGEGAYTIENVDISGLYGISDEQARININKASKETIAELLKQKGAADADGIAAAIVEWQDKNSGFEAIEEVLLADGRIKDIFYRADSNENGIIEPQEEGLERYITIYGDGVININTASMPVLEAILGKELAGYVVSRREGLIDKSAGRWFIYLDPNDLNAGQYINDNKDKIVNLHDDTPDEWLPGSDAADKGVLWDALRKKRQDGAIGVRSATFRINCLGEIKGIKRNIEAVAELDKDVNYEFLYWFQD